jgi:DNA-nicking Smr family endonuclease
MAKKKKNKNAKEKTSPFNNPFADNIRELRKGLRDQKPDRKVQSRNTDASDGTTAFSDEDAFREAMSGTSPVTARGREVTHSRNAQEFIKVRAEDFDVNELMSDENFDLRFSDRYIRASNRSVSKETLDKLADGVFTVRSHVDLHGMALDDAKQTVDEFLTDCQRRGERCVLVITGKGRNSPGQLGVLRQSIPEWLARGPSARRVLAFVTARQCDGGEGGFGPSLFTNNEPV